MTSLLCVLVALAILISLVVGEDIPRVSRMMGLSNGFIGKAPIAPFTPVSSSWLQDDGGDGNEDRVSACPEELLNPAGSGLLAKAGGMRIQVSLNYAPWQAL